MAPTSDVYGEKPHMKTPSWPVKVPSVPVMYGNDVTMAPEVDLDADSGGQPLFISYIKYIYENEFIANAWTFSNAKLKTEIQITLFHFQWSRTLMDFCLKATMIWTNLVQLANNQVTTSTQYVHRIIHSTVRTMGSQR